MKARAKSIICCINEFECIQCINLRFKWQVFGGPRIFVWQKVNQMQSCVFGRKHRILVWVLVWIQDFHVNLKSRPQIFIWFLEADPEFYSPHAALPGEVARHLSYRPPKFEPRLFKKNETLLGEAAPPNSGKKIMCNWNT